MLYKSILPQPLGVLSFIQKKKTYKKYKENIKVANRFLKDQVATW